MPKSNILTTSLLIALLNSFTDAKPDCADPDQKTNEPVRLKGLAGDISMGIEERVKLHPSFRYPFALNKTRNEDNGWRLSTPVENSVESILLNLRPNLEHLSPTVGSIVHGVALSKPMNSSMVGALRRLLLERKAIFFRNQNLSSESHLRFTKQFGELELHPFTAGKEGYPELLRLEHGKTSFGSENVFHSDVTWREEPSLGSVLYAREVPGVGGDTLFVDMYAAYHAMDPKDRNKVEGKSAEHDWHAFRTAQRLAGVSAEQIASQQKKYPAQFHPVVRTHPETGRKALFVNAAFTKRISGVDEREQTQLLSRLYDLAKVPEFACRFKWENGSVAFWDNRATQHYAVSDYFPNRRILERATIKGERPFYTAPAEAKSKPRGPPSANQAN